MDTQPKGESSMVDKPSSLSARITQPKTLNPPDSEDIYAPAGATKNLTSPTTDDLSHDVAYQSLRPDPAMPQDASPLNPKSFGLGAHGGSQSGEASFVPRPEEQPRQYSRVAESLSDNPNFSQAGFHISRYVLASVNTEAEQEQIKPLYSSMQTTSGLIDVGFHVPCCLLTLRPNSSLK
jgi:hypothetical protein